MDKAKMHNFHLPLSDNLYNLLREESLRLHIPATELARRAINFWLKQMKKAAIHKSICEYASQNAGSGLDLDVALEKVSVEYLISDKGEN